MNLNFKLFLVFLLFFLSCSSEEELKDTCINESSIDRSSVCIEIYQPVCGCDGVTDPNSCYATTFNGVTSYLDGACN